MYDKKYLINIKNIIIRCIEAIRVNKLTEYIQTLEDFELIMLYDAMVRKPYNNENLKIIEIVKQEKQYRFSKVK